MADRFKAGTWNLQAPTPTTVLKPILEAQLAQGVTVWAMQEARGQDITDMCQELGLETFLYEPVDSRRQWRTAWDPDKWVTVNTGGIRLSVTGWTIGAGPDEGDTVFSEMATTILCDKKGRSLDVGSFHWPAGIQPEDRSKRRYRAAVESARSMGEYARASECRGVLLMGDSNWDVTKGPQTAESELLFDTSDETGLRIVLPPDPTFGGPNGRKIDVHYTLRPVKGGGLRIIENGGYTAPGGGDHRLHVATYAWR